MTMKKILLVLGLTILAGAVAFAHDDGKPITLIGQVVDTGCYIHHDSKGADHADCAKMCAKAGVPLAILDDKGKLYLPIATDHKNQNLKLMPFIEKKVKITGTASDKGGLAGIAIRTIELAQ
jgi:hypothetical protein